MLKVVAGILVAVVMMCGVASAHKMPKSKIKSIFKNYAEVKAGVGRNRYQKFKEGPVYLRKAPKVTAIYHLALGHNLVPAASAELDLYWGKVCYKARSDSGINLHQTVKLSGFTVNGYYNILSAKLISPYVTAGAGLGINDTKDLMADSIRVQGKRTKSFIWNAGLGAKMKLSSRFDVDLGYRYMYLGKTHTDTSNPVSGLSGANQYVAGTQKIYGNQFLAGVSYHF